MWGSDLCGFSPERTKQMCGKICDEYKLHSSNNQCDLMMWGMAPRSAGNESLHIDCRKEKCFPRTSTNRSARSSLNSDKPKLYPACSLYTIKDPSGPMGTPKSAYACIRSNCIITLKLYLTGYYITHFNLNLYCHR